jgi:threonyl-tRNA synthetase
MSDQPQLSQQDNVQAMRHSTAHVFASAVMRLWPQAKLGVGPATATGFHYDLDLGETSLSEDDFSKIEEEMRKIVAENQTFERYSKPIAEAIQWATDAGQAYKQELLNDLQRAGTTVLKDLDSSELGLQADGQSKVDEVSFYRNGDFADLCRGPHVESTGKVGAFKLMKVSGVYWRGKEGNPQMQRVSGIAFKTPKELRQYLDMLEEAKKRDHRKLGVELDLFTFSELVGSGLPLFTPRGTVVREELEKYSNQLRQRHGFQKVSIPHITKKDLYETSGHWAKFGDELFLVKSQETSDDFVMKPMNCPHHTQIYASRPRSYRDLPIAYLETTMVYRDEKSGELGGLNRVRSITQDDSHAFCRQDQIESVIDSLLADANEFYGKVDMKLRVRMSYRDDSDAYLGDKTLWTSAQEQLKSAVIASQLEYFEQEGEAAFYGPKIDFMATDAIGREHQVATVQLDFVMPGRFGLEYADADGSQQQPVMIHCALMGSTERFMSVYIEHTAGKFPVWLAPEQIRLVTVNQEDNTVAFANSVAIKATEVGLRVVVDNDNESVGKKIRNAELMKVPYTVVIGEKEIETGSVVPRVRRDLVAAPAYSGSGSVEQAGAAFTAQAPVALSVDDFLTKVAAEVAGRISVSSL